MARKKKTSQEDERKRLMIVRQPFADGRGPLCMGKAYWFPESQANGLEKHGVLEAKAHEVLGHIKAFGAIGIVVTEETDPDMAKMARKHGLSIHVPEDK